MPTTMRNTFCVFDESTRTRVYETFKVDSSIVKSDIQSLQEWLKKQPHLPQHIDDDLLEKWLVRNKFKIENTKQRLEKYYTLKAIKAKEIAEISAALPKDTTEMIIPISQLNEKLERIVIVKVKNGNVDSEDDMKRSFKLSLCMSEYSLYCDYSLGQRVIIDFEGLTEHQVKKAAITLAPLAKPYLGAYFTRVAGLEYLNTPKVVEDLIRKIRFVLPAKMYSRIAVHKDLSSLHKNVSKAYLPPEYGGELKTSIPEILDLWNEEIKSNIDILEKIVATEIADENKRIGEKIGGLKYEEFFRLDGTFKQLPVDL